VNILKVAIGEGASEAKESMARGRSHGWALAESTILSVLMIG
jgi:hypothetical protein